MSKGRKEKPPETPEVFFRFLGYLDGWYALRADMSGIEPMAAHATENEIVDWLISNRITPGKWSHFGNGNTGTQPWLPAVHDGSSLCVIFKRPTDVVRFETRFLCVGITPDIMLEAIRDEAKTKINASQVAQIAYAAACKLQQVSGNDPFLWEELNDDERKASIDFVTLLWKNPESSASQIHEMTGLSGPTDIPFERLPLSKRIKIELFRNIVLTLLPLTDCE